MTSARPPLVMETDLGRDPDDLFALVEAGLARAKGQTGERIGVAE